MGSWVGSGFRWGVDATSDDVFILFFYGSMHFFFGDENHIPVDMQLVEQH